MNNQSDESDVAGRNTHVFADDGTQARDPEQTSTAHMVDEEPFAAEHGFTESLGLIVLDDSLRAGQEGVFAHLPELISIEAKDRDVAERWRRQQELSRPGVGRMSHFTASYQLLEAELYTSSEGDG